MITVRTKIDEASQKILTKKIRVGSLISMIIGIVGLLIYIILSINFENLNLDFLLFFSIPFAIGLVLLITIHKNIAKTASYQWINEYVFEKNAIHISTIKNEDVIGTHKLYYKDIYKVKEYDDYLFIFINKANAYILKKSNTTELELNKIKELINLK